MMAVKLETLQESEVTVAIQLRPEVIFTMSQPKQVGGLVPFSSCENDCRDVCNTDKPLPVFGNLINRKYAYDNDYNTFLFRQDNKQLFPSLVFQFILQKNIRGIWQDIDTLSSTLGKSYPFGSLSGFPNYTGYQLNWGSVLLYHGQGCYRVKINSQFEAATDWREDTFTQTISFPTSEPFYRFMLSNGEIITFYYADENVTADELISALNNNAAAIRNGLTFSYTYSLGVLTLKVKSRENNYVTTIYYSDVTLVRTGTTHTSADETPSFCLASPSFRLVEWDCNRADKTVKLETFTNGLIGDKRTDYLLHDFGELNWYDSIRLYGYFGEEKIVEYLRVRDEWGKPKHGLIQEVKNEAVSEFTLYTHIFSKPLHERLMYYMALADEVIISDYNLVNPDYNLKRLAVTFESSYEAEETANYYKRGAKATLKFRKRVQSAIKSKC